MVDVASSIFYLVGVTPIQFADLFWVKNLENEEKLVRYTCSKSTGRNFSKTDGRGKDTPYNKTPNEMLDGVRSHIESFPKVESYYCHKSFHRQHLTPYRV